jgi:hypothetical protein
MRIAAIIQAVAVLAGGVILNFGDSRQALGDNYKLEMPKAAFGFSGTLSAQVAKAPDKVYGWFEIKVVKVIGFARNNKTKLRTPAALTKVWKDKYVAVLGVKGMPELKVGDMVTVTAFTREVHLRSSKVSKAKPVENEAEKLFRGMEEKVRAAKSLQLHFDVSITDADAKTWKLNGNLILGEGDRVRLQLEGKLFGEAVKFTLVSDGISTKAVGVLPMPKDDKSAKSPKGSGAYFRATLPREGFFVSFLNHDRGGGVVPDFKMSDFKRAGKEKIGKRNAQVIQYTVKVKDKNPLAMTMWLDMDTNLPVKFFLTAGKTDIMEITETYGQFTIDGKVDAKLFELPK